MKICQKGFLPFKWLVCLDFPFAGGPRAQAEGRRDHLMLYVHQVVHLHVLVHLHVGPPDTRR